MRSLVLLGVAILLTCANAVFGQNAVDSVFVELYHVEPGTEGRPAVSTYRIYVDLAPEHELQMVYGDDRHPMVFHTTSTFINDTAHGGEFGRQISANELNISQAALDSWITIVQACDSFAGVPRTLDTDGSILPCPPSTAQPGARKRTVRTDGSTPLCKVDGLVRNQGSREIIPFNFTTSYLGPIVGNLLETTNGAWAVPGGSKGVTDRNIVLIGQFTTTGELAYRINLQVETPQHEAVKYVWRDPGPGEFVAKGSAYGTYLRQAPPTY
jgi:hypothetical protein